MKTKGFVTYHGHRYQVTPGTLRVLAGCQEDPTDTLLLYHMLRAEGYTAEDLNRPALDAPPQATQLPLFTEDSLWTSH